MIAGEAACTDSKVNLTGLVKVACIRRSCNTGWFPQCDALQLSSIILRLINR